MNKVIPTKQTINKDKLDENVRVLSSDIEKISEYVNALPQLLSGSYVGGDKDQVISIDTAPQFIIIISDISSVQNIAILWIKSLPYGKTLNITNGIISDIIELNIDKKSFKIKAGSAGNTPGVQYHYFFFGA